MTKKMIPPAPGLVKFILGKNPQCFPDVIAAAKEYAEGQTDLFEFIPEKETNFSKTAVMFSKKNGGNV
jgi:hypothetical protein